MDIEQAAGWQARRWNGGRDLCGTPPGSARHAVSGNGRSATPTSCQSHLCRDDAGWNLQCPVVVPTIGAWSRRAIDRDSYGRGASNCGRVDRGHQRDGAGYRRCHQHRHDGDSQESTEPMVPQKVTLTLGAHLQDCWSYRNRNATDRVRLRLALVTADDGSKRRTRIAECTSVPARPLVHQRFPRFLVSVANPATGPSGKPSGHSPSVCDPYRPPRPAAIAGPNCGCMVPAVFSIRHPPKLICCALRPGPNGSTVPKKLRSTCSVVPGGPSSEFRPFCRNCPSTGRSSDRSVRLLPV